MFAGMSDGNGAGGCDSANGWLAGAAGRRYADFSLIGILAPIAQILADAKVGIFVVSTYNTDYVLVRETQLEHAVSVLADAGYQIE